MCVCWCVCAFVEDACFEDCNVIAADYHENVKCFECLLLWTFW